MFGRNAFKGINSMNFLFRGEMRSFFMSERECKWNYTKTIKSEFSFKNNNYVTIITVL